MDGWVAIYRKSKKHWLYTEERNFSRFEAWIDMILSANHCDNKVFMDGQFVEVKRGSMITSLRGLAEKFRWSTKKVKTFLTLLENEGMVEFKCDTKKTIIAIVNYGVYQDFENKTGNTKEIREKPKGNSKETQRKTNNKDKQELNNENKNTYGEFVTMTNAEYQRLVGTYGEENTRRMIEVLDNYKGSTGKKYKCDYRAILSWVADRVLDDKKVIAIPNAGAYKQEADKCPYCGDAGWVVEDGNMTRCRCQAGIENV